MKAKKFKLTSKTLFVYRSVSSNAAKGDPTTVTTTTSSMCAGAFNK